MAEKSSISDLKNLSLTSNGKPVEKNQQLVVCFGEMLIDFVPTVGGVSLAEAPAFQKAPGGAPANVAVCISKLGGSSAFIGKGGDDEFGRMLDGILKQHKVDNSGVRNPSADMLLHESELDIDLIKKSAIFHYGSISLIDEPCRLPLWPSEEAARSGIMSIWDRADIIKISEDEISFLTGGDDPYDDDVVIKKLFHPNLLLLIVTEGSAGCRYYTKQFKGRVNSIAVKAVDTTGAGDSFVGGLLSHLASDINLYQDEKRLREALFFANACAALTVTQRGAIPALPTREAISSFISERQNRLCSDQ